MKRLQRAAFFILLLGFPAVSAAAQSDIAFEEETPGNREGEFFTLEGVITGNPVVVDQEFAVKYETPVLECPFRVILPQSSGRQSTAGEGQYLSVAYFEGEQPAEIIRFTGLTVPMGEREERITVLADLLIEYGPSLSFSSWADGQFEGIYKTQIGGRYDAVTLQGWVQDTQKGTYWVRLCGILHPEKAAGILVFVLIDPALTGIQPVDLTSAGETLKIIHSIEFLD